MKHMTNALYPFQQTAVDQILAAGNKVILTSSMGTGGTSVLAAAASHLPKSDTILILCPKILRGMWGYELAKQGIGTGRYEMETPHGLLLRDRRERLKGMKTVIVDNMSPGPVMAAALIEVLSTASRVWVRRDSSNKSPVADIGYEHVHLKMVM